MVKNMVFEVLSGNQTWQTGKSSMQLSYKPPSIGPEATPVLREAPVP